MLTRTCLVLFASTCLAANPMFAQDSKPAAAAGTNPAIDDIVIQADEIRLEAQEIGRHVAEVGKQAAEAGKRAADQSQRVLEDAARTLYVDTFAPGKLSFRAVQARTEKGPVIGVSATPVPAVLRDQLKLKPGVGLVVDFVTSDGPAAKAGLRKNDVMEKFDDQLLINPQQLAVLVRTRKPGDAVALAIIREAQPQSITVTVAEGDVPPIDDVISADSAIRVNKLAKPFNAPALTFSGAPVNWRLSDSVASFDMNWSDKEHSFEITQEKGNRKLVAKDKAGKELFSGPIDTPEQIEKLPAEIRDKVKKLDTKWREQAPATRPANQPPPGGV